MRILKPVVGGHDGSSFRELLDIWEEMGLCEVVPGPTPTKTYPGLDHVSQYPESRPWVDRVGGILLYDNPILDKLSQHLTWEMALWANQVHKAENCFPWTFWAKHPRIMEKIRKEGIPDYSGRAFESIFIGTFTTGLRGGHDWSKAIQKYWMGQHSQRIVSNDQYLNLLKNSRFGLCLPGVGPKCLRDIELIGMGTVPVFTPGVSTDYYNPPQKNVHYLYAESPEEVREVIAKCSPAQWTEMSEACLEWYEANSSPQGSFNLTQKIIEDNRRKK